MRKSIVIAGASSGIGAALAQALAADGHHLYICSRRTELLAEVAKGHTSTFYLGCDVGKEAEVQKFYDLIRERTSSIDALIYCVGVLGPIGLFDEIDSEQWFEAVRSNLFGAYIMAKHVVPLMNPAKWPRILMMSGGGAFDPMPRVSAYGVSKAAIIRLVETLAVELKPRNIAVNAIAPGFVATDIHRATLAAGPRRGGEHYQTTVRLLAEEEGDIQMPVNCVRYMISEVSAKLTGKTISARHDPWGEAEFDNCIDEIMASSLYSTQRTNLVHLRDVTFVERLTSAAENKRKRKELKLAQQVRPTR